MRNLFVASLAVAAALRGSLIMWAQSVPDGFVTSKQTVIPGDCGPIAVTTFSGAALQTGGLRLDVESLYSPATGALWIGARADSYFHIGGSIWGARVDGFNLMLQPPAGFVESARVPSVASDWLANHGGLVSSVMHCADGTGFDLRAVFGSELLTGPDGRPRLEGRRFTAASVTNLVVASNSVTLEMIGAASNTLALVLAPAWDIVAATANGEAVIVVSGGKIQKGQKVHDDLAGWPRPRKNVLVVSALGPIKAFSTFKGFDGADAALSTIRAVLLPSGELWFGPLFAKLAQVNGRLVGFDVKQATGELLVYVGPRTTIRMGASDVGPAFRAALAAFDGDFAAGRFMPDKSLKVADYLGDDPDLANDPLTGILQVSATESVITVVIQTGLPQQTGRLRDRKNVAMRLNAADFQVLSVQGTSHRQQ